MSSQITLDFRTKACSHSKCYLCASDRTRGAVDGNPIGGFDDGWVMLALQADEALVTGSAGDGEA